MTSIKRRINHREIFLIFVLIALGILIRIIQIDQPFIDAWTWRQSDVAMIAENFYRHGFNIFYPQIDWAGSSPGYIGTEFPLVPFIASLLYVFFDVHEWIGRSISVLFFAASVSFLYLLVRKISNERSALFAVGIYTLAPLSIFSSRSFMSDMASLSFSIAALYLFAEWLERPIPKLFIAMTIATSLAILVKLPAIIIGVPLLYMTWEKYRVGFVFRRELWAFAVLSLIFPLTWYSHAHLVSGSYFPYHFTGQGGIKVMGLEFYLRILYMTVTSSLTLIVSAAMLVGIILPSRAKFGRVFHWWLIAIILFIFIAGWGNRHLWYQLPIVPVAAAFAGFACDFALRRLEKLTNSKLALVSACLIFLTALAYLSYIYVKPLYEPWAIPLLKAGNELNRIAPPDALLVVPGRGDSTVFYYSRRKGWHFVGSVFGGAPRNSQQAISELEKLRKEGTSYLVFTKYTSWWLDYYKDFRKHLDSRYRRVRDTHEYVIFDLTVAKTE